MRIMKKIILYLISGILLFGVGYVGYGITTQYIMPKTEKTSEKEVAKTKEDKKEKKTSKIKEKGEGEEEQQQQSDEWKEAYVEWINNQKEGATFKLCYVNEDTIPEIICLEGCNADGTTFATYANGQVQEENVWGAGVSYIEGENVLDDGSGNMGNYYDHIYTIRKGKWVQIAKGEYGIGDNTELDATDESDYSYTWNGKKMSKENYEKNLKKIYDKKSATNLDDSYKCVSAEELINELIGSDEETTFDSAKDKSMEQMQDQSNRKYSDITEDYIFSDSDKRKLKMSELKEMSKDELRIARNEIMARHGRIFNDDALRNYFENKSWYDGTIAPDEFDKMKEILNSTERANAKLIEKYEKKMGYR